MAIDTSAGAVASTALNSIPFSSLIGGPLNACIEAQAMAARTSWEFIQKVGLTEDPDTGETKAVNVTFQYNKNGKMTNLVVPILTIVPIPFLAIEEVIIEFMANISASSSSSSETSTSEDLGAGGSASGAIGWGPFSLTFDAQANYSSKKDSKASQESQYSVEYSMDVKVEGGQADMPAGLATVLNILQSSITESSPGGRLELSPVGGTIDNRVGATLNMEAKVLDPLGVVAAQTIVNFEMDSGTTNYGGDNLALSVTRGTQEGESGADGSIFKLIGRTDNDGVIGIQIKVETLPANFSPGLMKVDVTSTIQVQNGDGENVPLEVSDSVRIRAMAGEVEDVQEIVQEIAPSLRSLGTASATPQGLQLQSTDPAVLRFNQNSGQSTLNVKVLDGTGKPVSGTTVKAISHDETIVEVSPGSATSDNNGVVSFTVASGKSGGSSQITLTSANALLPLTYLVEVEVPAKGGNKGNKSDKDT